jgi:hypothetical protein
MYHGLSTIHCIMFLLCPVYGIILAKRNKNPYTVINHPMFDGLYCQYIKMVMFPWGWCGRLWHCFNQKITRIMYSHAIYPLVNQRNHGKIHHFSWVNPLFLWPFSMSLFVYRESPAGLQILHGNPQHLGLQGLKGLLP